VAGAFRWQTPDLIVRPPFGINFGRAYRIRQHLSVRLSVHDDNRADDQDQSDNGPQADDLAQKRPGKKKRGNRRQGEGNSRGRRCNPTQRPGVGRELSSAADHAQKY